MNPSPNHIGWFIADDPCVEAVRRPGVDSRPSLRY
jgi:hypothetical protein